ncbi:uncharacterized protein LOC127002873 [Eriocheir sinensis]|uniref:uncharacterized protein LOC127002873 n=1 Tax=Eriocheir sinensis TaxID=95602 RepID=UPI0021CACEAE|nr:uncharacterized protein LOC127002873 [Eriocheir sinensis]
MTKLSAYPRTKAVHAFFFCDGSVNGSRTGCELFVRDYTSPSIYTDTEVSKRLPDSLSSTRAELHAILESLHITVALWKTVYLFDDSQSALYALLSSSPSDCDIVNRCLSALSLLERCGATAHFIWVPSHVGLPHNEKADRLVRAASDDLIVHPSVEYTYNYVKNRLRSLVSESVTNQLALRCQDGSPSRIHYAQVSSFCTHTYGRLSASYDLVVMRLRLGYRYYWEVSGADPVPCRLCAGPGGHTLKHYVLQCPAISAYRPQGHWDMPELVGGSLTIMFCQLCLASILHLPLDCSSYVQSLMSAPLISSRLFFLPYFSTCFLPLYLFRFMVLPTHVLIVVQSHYVLPGGWDGMSLPSPLL